jgi:single-stranded DNA-binding protein
MITASITGRMAFEPRQIQTKSGKPMSTARLACDDGEGHTIWIDVVTFTSNAEWLARATKGDRIAAMGTLKMNCWQGKDGEEKQVLQLVADNVIVPTAKPRKQSSQKEKPAPKQPVSDPFQGADIDEASLPF